MVTENDKQTEQQSDAAEAAAEQQNEEAKALPEAPEEVEAEIPEPPKSRRQRAQEETDKKLARAAEIAEATAKRQQEFEERMSRALEQRPQYQQPQQYREPQRQEPQVPRNYDQELYQLDRERRQLFGTNDIDKFMEVSNKISAIQAEKIIQERLSRIRIPQQEPPTPAWVRAVESRYPDVLAHPGGARSVSYHTDRFAMMGENVHSVDALTRAFEAAAADLNLRKPQQQSRSHSQDDDTASIPDNREARREMLGNSRSQNLSGRSSGGGNGGGGKGGISVSGLSKGWESVAYAAYPTISKEDAKAKYLRAYAKMNPDKVMK